MGRASTGLATVARLLRQAPDKKTGTGQEDRHRRRRQAPDVKTGTGQEDRHWTRRVYQKKWPDAPYKIQESHPTTRLSILRQNFQSYDKTFKYKSREYR